MLLETPSFQLLVKPCLLYELFLFFSFFLAALFSLKRRPSESMTKEVIPHNVTIFPYIKEVMLRY